MSIDISEGPAIAWAECIDLDDDCPWEFHSSTICALCVFLERRVRPAHNWDEVAVRAISLPGRRCA